MNTLYKQTLHIHTVTCRYCTLHEKAKIQLVGKVKQCVWIDRDGILMCDFQKGFVFFKIKVTKRITTCTTDRLYKFCRSNTGSFSRTDGGWMDEWIDKLDKLYIFAYRHPDTSWRGLACCPKSHLMGYYLCPQVKDESSKISQCFPGREEREILLYYF